MAAGFSKTIRERYTKKWGKQKGYGPGNLLNKRRPVVDTDQDIKTKETNFPLKKMKSKRKCSNKSKRKKSKRRKRR